MADKVFVRCGKFFSGNTDQILENQTLVVEGGNIVRIAPSADVPATREVDELDFADCFVIPGLIDVHTHLAYGNAKTEEDIDLYASLEFRALRGMFFAHQVLAAGFTSINAPGDSGMVTSAIRDAVDAGLFEGPNVTAAGPYITSRQGLTDWYPTWIGTPTTSIGRLVKSRDEAIEEIRRQVKDGVDGVKIALDGIQRRPNGEHIAAFTLEETKAMVDEIHRLGKIAIVHARGREATLYAGKAGVDLIFHASFMDDEGLEAVLRNKCTISPTLTLLRNTIDFIQPGDPYHRKGRRDSYQIEFDSAVEVLQKARRAGVPMPTGTDSGFAVTPYGEWHARELEIYVEYLGFSPLEALRAATSVSAAVLRPRDRVGILAPGYKADLVALHADPTTNISVLLEREKFAAVVKNGKLVSEPRRQYDPRRVSDFAMTMFSDVYTRDRVAELQGSVARAG
jgi:imidazolonepropionase-like amidohydrolase